MQCKSDLKSDEEIFAEKSRQQTDLQETIDRLEREHAELSQQLDEAQEKIHQLSEQVLAKQLEIDASNARVQVLTECLVSRLKSLTILGVWRTCSKSLINEASDLDEGILSHVCYTKTVIGKILGCAFDVSK